MSKPSTLGAFVQFLKREKVYWITPLVLFVIVVLLLLLLGGDGPLSEFLYPMF